MIRKPVVLVLLAITLFGCLGGLIAAVIQPARYQAEAYVVVYEMPRGFTELLSPDEAANLTATYQAGVFQPEVLKQVETLFPNMSKSDIEKAIQVELVAYTPLTRIVATAPSRDEAVRLADTVAATWTSVAGTAIAKAYSEVKAQLDAHEVDISRQMASVDKKLQNPALSASASAALQAQLQSLDDAFTKTDTAILDLDQTKFNVAGNAYIAISATDSDVVKLPDPLKTAAIGTVAGLALGIVAALWLTRRWLQQTIYPTVFAARMTLAEANDEN